MTRADSANADLTRHGVGSTILHTVSTPHSIWVRHENGWRNPIGSPERGYDDKWADDCLRLRYAEMILSIDPPEEVELPTKGHHLGWLTETATANGSPERHLLVFNFGRRNRIEDTSFGAIGRAAVVAFEPATAVPTEALENLRSYADSLVDSDHATRDTRRIWDFLAAINRANA